MNHAKASLNEDTFTTEQQDVFKKIFYKACEAGADYICGDKAVTLMRHFGEDLSDGALAKI
jgi:hypothetical protein